jgi:hypothetical protein
MIRLFRKSIAFLVCSVGLILPWRLRCLYSEILGWITQFIYLNYIGLLKFIIAELQKAKLQAGKTGGR